MRISLVAQSDFLSRSRLREGCHRSAWHPAKQIAKLFFIGTILFPSFVWSVDSQEYSRDSHPPSPSFPNGFPTDPSFIPIGVWLQSPSNGSAYKSMGINTFVGLWGGPTRSQLAELERNGLFVVTEQNDLGLSSLYSKVIKAWMHPDEPDNAQKNALGLSVTCVPPSSVAKRTRLMKQRDSTRPIMINFGRGVADPTWPGRGTCTGDLDYYVEASRDVDIASFDVYPVASPAGLIKGRLEYIVRGVTNLRKWAHGARSVWAVIETTRISHDSDRPSPRQIRAEVWLAVIAGARGIVYFVHEFSHGFREDGIFRYPDAVDAVRRVNKELSSLAPVLNDEVGSELIMDETGSVPALLKSSGVDTYLFAASMSDQTVKVRLKIDTTHTSMAEVIGEGRSLRLFNGLLEDEFSGYDVHLYRLKAGAN